MDRPCKCSLPPFFAVSLSLILAALVSGQATLSDVDGTYTALRTKLTSCPQKLVLNNTSDAVARAQTEDIIFDDTVCLAGEIEFSESRGYRRWGEQLREDLGNRVINGTGRRLRCNSTDDLFEFDNFFVFRPRVSRNYFPSQHEVFLEAGTVYIDLWLESPVFGECLYKKITADPLRPSPSVTPVSRKEKLEEDTAKVTNLWAWLGPVLGSIATLIAALIAVYCVREEKSRNRQIDPNLAKNSPPPFES